MSKVSSNLIPETKAVVIDRFDDNQVGIQILRAHQGLYSDPSFKTQLHADALSDLEHVWIAREYAHQMGARPADFGYFADVTRAYQALFFDDRKYSAIRDFVRRRLRTLDALSELPSTH